MANPNLIASYEVLGGATTLSLATPSFTPDNGEVIIVKAASESFDKPTIDGVSGGGLTYTSHAHISQVSHTVVRLWSTVVSGSPGSMTVTATFGANDGYHSMVVERWGNAQLAGSPAVTQTLSSNAPSATIDTTATDSVVSWVSADWNAVAPGTPAYRSSAVQTGIHDQSTSFYVAYYAYQNAGSAGTQTFGLTSPTGQEASMIGIEVQATAGATTPTVTTQAVTNLAVTTATGNGTVVADGGDTITERGVCWSTSTNPTTSDSKATSAGTTGSYNVSITGLTNGTLYHARAYAINGQGTSYGNDVTFRPYATTIGWFRA